MKIERREVQNGLIQFTTADERWYYHTSKNEWYKSSSWVCGYIYKGREFEEYLKRTGKDADVILEEAGDRGNKVHGAIHLLVHRKATQGEGYLDVEKELFMNNSNGLYEQLKGEECEIVLSFVNWFKNLEEKYRVEIIDYEVSDFNEEWKFAGTRDLRIKLQIKEPIVFNPKRKTQEEDLSGTWLIDYKTSKAIYLSHIAQISSYRRMPGCANDRLAILQVGYKLNKTGYKFTEVEDKFHIWLSANVQWLEENENKTPKQFEIPQLLKI